MSSPSRQQAGRSFPLGATLGGVGANFSLFAKHSRSAQLLLFDSADAPLPSRVIDLDPHINRTPSCRVSPPAKSMPTAFRERSIRNAGIASTRARASLRPEQGAARSF
jgi:pullulanase/glycogen debranching enzyme